MQARPNRRLDHFAGRPRTHLHGDFHHRNVHQNPGVRIHFTQEQLHAEFMEYNGLCRRCFRVRLFFALDSCLG